MKKCKKAYRYGYFALQILSLLLGEVIARSSVQAVALPSQSQEINISDLLKLPGRVLGKGSNTKPVGKHQITTYRIEEVTLPHPMEVEIGGKRTQLTRALRVTIIGGPFAVRALPPVIWIDDVAVGYGVENEDLTEITTVTFDPALLREGATLYLSYGDKKIKEDRVELPEKLKLDGAKLRIEYLMEGKKVLAGQATKIRFKLFDTATGQPKDGLEDVRVLVFLAPGIWQNRGLAQAIGGGIYEVSFTLPQSGLYYIYVESRSQGITFQQLPSLKLQVADVANPSP